MRRSKYSKEFKDSTVQLILNNNESVVKVAADLDLNSGLMKKLGAYSRSIRKSSRFLFGRFCEVKNLD